MKRNDWKIILGAVLFTGLFYKQEAGLNYLIFSLFLVLTSAFNAKELLKKPTWFVSSLGAILSGTFVFLYGTPLPVITNIISLVLVAGFSLQPTSSFIVAGIHSILSFASSLPFMFINAFKKKEKGSTENEKSSHWHKALLLVLPLLIVGLFFTLYRGASPEFMEFTEDINLKWISMPLIRFFLLGTILLYGFYCQKVLQSVVEKDHSVNDEISTKTEEDREHTFLGKKLSISSEVFIGTSLLLMLNLLIGLVNALDITKVWTNPVLPETDTYSSFLHSGVSMLILSIILAIGIILFFFRSYLNFYPKNTLMRLLGFVWIIQNIVLIISTIFRNNMYIDAYALSHKRIGVFIYLALCIIGLIITFVKLLKKKNNWFLLRKNSWAFYLFMLACTVVNWDMIITNYNIKHALKTEQKIPDLEYLSRLSDVNNSTLIPFSQGISLFSVYYADQEYSNKSINNKFNSFLKQHQENAWPSFCLNHSSQLKEIEKLNDQSVIQYLDLSDVWTGSLEPYFLLNNIEGLWLTQTLDSFNLDDLNEFQKLKALNLSANDLAEPSSRNLRIDSLRFLNISDNPIKSYSFLSSFPNLTHLDISDNLSQIVPTSLPKIESLSHLNIKENNWKNWDFLTQFPNLESLQASVCNECNFIDSIPELTQLTTVEVERSSIGLQSKTSLLSALSKSAPNVASLILNDNYIDSVTDLVYPSLLFSKTQYLNLSSNRIVDADLLSNYKTLQHLDLSHNEIFNLKWEGISIEHINLSNNPLQHFTADIPLTNLIELNLHQTDIKDINALPGAPALEILNLSETDVSQLDSVVNFPSLITLNLSYTPIQDLSVLGELKHLKNLHINQLSQLNYEELPELDAIEFIYADGLGYEVMKLLREKYPEAQIHNSYISADSFINIETRY